MLIAIAVVASVFVSFCYFLVLMLVSGRSHHQMIDINIFRNLLRSKMQASHQSLGRVGNPQRLCEKIKAAFIPRWVGTLLVNQTWPERFPAHYQEARAESEFLIGKIAGFKSGRLLLHLIFLGSLVGILYADGMETFWVICPVTMALIVSGVFILLYREMTKEAVSHLRSAPTVVIEIGAEIQEICKAS